MTESKPTKRGPRPEATYRPNRRNAVRVRRAKELAAKRRGEKL
jgi:hypothetical protein